MQISAIKEKSGVLTWLLFFLSLFVYISFLVLPYINLADSGDFLVNAYELGITHPPGYALNSLWGRILLNFAPKNLYPYILASSSAFFMVLSGFFLFLSLNLFFPKQKFLSAFLILFYFFNPYNLKVSTIIEIYALDNFLFSLTFFIFLKALKDKSWRLLYLFSYLAGFSVSFRVINSVYLFPLFLFILWQIWQEKSFKKIIYISFFFFLPFTHLIYYPLRDLSSKTHFSVFVIVIGDFWTNLYYLFTAKIYQTRFKWNNFSLFNLSKVLEYLFFQFNGLILIFLVFYLKSTRTLAIFFRKRFIFFFLLFLYFSFFTLFFFASYKTLEIGTMMGVFILFTVFIFSFLILFLAKKISDREKILYIVFIFSIIVSFNIRKHFNNIDVNGFTYINQFVKLLPPKSILFSIKDSEIFSFSVEKYVYGKKFSAEVVTPFRKDWMKRLYDFQKLKLASYGFYSETIKNVPYYNRKFKSWYLIKNVSIPPRSFTPETKPDFVFKPFLNFYLDKLDIHFQDGIGAMQFSFKYCFLKAFNLNIDVFRVYMFILKDKEEIGIENLLKERANFVDLMFGKPGEYYSDGIIFRTLSAPLNKGKYNVFMFIKHYNSTKLSSRLVDFDLNALSGNYIFKQNKGVTLLSDFKTGKKIFKIGHFEIE